MFFKVLAAFSLAALALNVNAAPPALFSSLETPMLSCSANGNFAPFAVPVNSLSEIEPGEYALYNEAFGGNPLRSYKLNQPIFLSRSIENPRAYGMWEIEPLSPDEYMITNIGLGASAYATSKARQRCHSQLGY
ncbi:hypothetical protein MSAN_01645000 [Mycena sanguinolenta]|uniref:Uncharacterized protein n=1 Tax=Mycena sanguinolenta TaxID=230812 RepID=A0A8H7CWQ7_9AGAR|nr:hypothetical protein MSAN_01645000 [Mycena sanguinolenta]